MFEEELIKETTAYLKEEYLRQTTLLSSDEYSDFLYTLVNQELSRIQELNISISKQKIIKVHIFECVIPFFQNDQVILALLSKFTKDIGLSKIIRLHEIASYHQNSLDLFFTKLGLAIENTGKSMICLEEITNIQTDQSCLDLIKNIIMIHDKVEQMKSKLNILSEKKYSSLLNQHFHNFINHSDHRQFFPKSLARYIDIQLKNYKTKLNYDEILIVIEKSLKIFKFIEEKDIFEQFYRRFLATKLLSNIYYEEIEAKIISNLKIECGAIFTHRCEVMINDIKSSENMFSQFRTSKFYINPTKLEFGVKILTQGNWPISSLDSMNITHLDKKNKNFEFIGILDHFRKFFAAFYPGKKINFKMNLGNAEIVAKFSKSLYFLNVSTLQAFICLLMNKYKRLPFKSILEMLQIKEVQIVNSHIIPLIKSGLLLVDEAKPIINNVEGITPEIQINMTSIISLNTGFYSKHQKIKFNLSKNTEKIMVAHKQDAIDAERRYHIEASIIRVMKNKKSCEHNDLTNEVIKSLSSSFVPSLFIIKQRIESLIERSYLKRSDKGYNIYTYTD